MNNKMMFLETKIQKFTQVLDKFRYKNRFADFKMFICEGEDYNENALSEIKINDRWGGYDKYCWLKMNVELPKEYNTSEIKLGYFDFGITGGGGNSGFESLCYVNGKMYQGVDTNHKEIFLPKDGTKFEIKFKLWAGLDGGGNERDISLLHEIKRAEFLILDKPIDNLYYLSVAIFQTLKNMDKADKIYSELSTTIDSIYNQIELVDENILRAQAPKLYGELVEKLKAIPDLKNVITRCIGHTHIDVAWLWRLKHTREKAIRSFSTVMRFMELYPKYVFLQTQPQLYQYIKEDAPELYEEIKARVKEGRWEVNGGMWVEADCNLTSGESLVRQLLHGKKFFKDEFGATSNCLWLPDVFGYSAAMPQILKKSGIDTFMTTKISWNQYNRIPNDTFNWKGIDGSEVLTHFVTTPEEGGGGWSAYTYNGLVNSFTVNGIWKEYRNKELNNETLLSYGYGDGGGGVNREMLEMIDKLSLVPSNPQITTGTAGEYFDELHEKIKDKKVNKWDGELYLEFHRGTYTSQAKTKKANRKLEYMLRNSEIFSSLYAGNDYPFDLYDATWKKVLTHQFHDILPGSSITEVYADAAKTYKEIEETLGENLNQTAVKNSVSENNVWTVFNFNNFSGEKNIYIKTSKSFNFTDSNKNRLRSQKVREGYLVTVSLQGISSKIIFGEEIQETYAQLNSNIFEINNENYVLKWNEKGYLTSIFDKVQQKEMLKEKEAGNEICMFEDIPRLYDAWELEPYYINKKYPVNKLISSKLIEDGEIEKTVEFVWEIGNSKISQKLVLQNNSRRIDFVTHVNWQEQNKILRTFFPVNVRASKATFDIQFGNIERPTHKNTEWDFAKFEVVGHKWADISQRDSGMALLNNCKYGYSAAESTLGLSLLKSPIAPDKTADIGEHTFIYSILPHAKDWYECGLEEEAVFLNNPPIVFSGKLKEVKPFCIDKNIIVDAIKLSENQDGYIIRMHEYSGKESMVKVEPNILYKTWCETNLMEDEISKRSENNIEIKFSPYEIKTIKLLN